MSSYNLVTSSYNCIVDLIIVNVHDPGDLNSIRMISLIEEPSIFQTIRIIYKIPMFLWLVDINHFIIIKI